MPTPADFMQAMLKGVQGDLADFGESIGTVAEAARTPIRPGAIWLVGVSQHEVTDESAMVRTIVRAVEGDEPSFVLATLLEEELRGTADQSAMSPLDRNCERCLNALASACNSPGIGSVPPRMRELVGSEGRPSTVLFVDSAIERQMRKVLKKALGIRNTAVAGRTLANAFNTDVAESSAHAEGKGAPDEQRIRDETVARAMMGAFGQGPAEWMVSGARVEVVGLMNATALNGCRGTLLERRENGRWVVGLENPDDSNGGLSDGGRCKKNIKPENLHEHQDNVVAAATPKQRSKTKIGPNERCPCESGKKYKRCCRLAQSVDSDALELPPDVRGRTPSSWFVSKDLNGERPNQLWGWRTEFENALTRGDTVTARRIAAAQDDVDVREFIEMRLLLVTAAANGLLEVCKLLVEELSAAVEGFYAAPVTANPLYRQCQVKSCGEKAVRNSPLWTACYRGRTEVAKYLAAAGANVSRVNGWGLPPLHTAASRCDKATVGVLLRAGASVHQLDAHGTLPWEVAQTQMIAQADEYRHNNPLTKSADVTMKPWQVLVSMLTPPPDGGGSASSGGGGSGGGEHSAATCAQCAAATGYTLRCPCGSVAYCTENCQKLHWAQHKAAHKALCSRQSRCND